MKETNKLKNLLLMGGFFLLGHMAYSEDASWNVNPVDNNWNNPANWSTGSVPGDFDDATFDVSLIHDPEIILDSFIDKIIFDQTADAFTITATSGVYLALGDGVANNSGVEQNFVAESNGGTSGSIIFNGGEVTGPVTFTIQARNSATGYAGFLQFGFAGPGSATIHNLGASVAGGAGGGTGFFFGNNSAENSTIINDGATAAGATGGNCGFAKDEPTAGNATLIANGGSNGGGGGFFTFLNRSTGGTARVELFGNGYLDISAHGSELITIGSLEGDGIVYLGDNTLTVVGNGLDTTFSGTLLPGDPSGGAGTGGLAKSSSTTLTLTGANFYTAGTTVTAGTLVVSNASGSATGTGAVFVNAGSLAGGGTIAGPVTIGIGSGAGAILAPAQGGTEPLTIAIQSSITLNADATYTYTFNESRTDLVVANGVTINGATVNLSGQTQGRLNLGETLTMITNRSANPISGTFSNLPDGAIVTVDGNNFQASYSGGDGNDLTLLVVSTPTPTPSPTLTPTPTPIPTSTPTPTPTPSPSPTPSPTPSPATQSHNVSTRLDVGTGDNVAIGGIIITGNGPKRVLLRAIGPSLSGAGIMNPLSDPVLELHAGDQSLITTNDNWKDTQEGDIEATGLAPTNPLESAIIATLDPGPYTAIVSGKNGVTGVGLVEAYDLDQTAVSQLGNISTRGSVETEANVMIGGFILGPAGAQSTSVLIRAIGPSLVPLGVSNALADPTLELHDSNGAVLGSNDNWRTDHEAEIEATGLAPKEDLESSILMTLPPGGYTAIVAGSGGTTGVALVEIYRLP